MTPGNCLKCLDSRSSSADRPSSSSYGLELKAARSVYVSRLCRENDLAVLRREKENLKASIFPCLHVCLCRFPVERREELGFAVLQKEVSRLRVELRAKEVEAEQTLAEK